MTAIIDGVRYPLCELSHSDFAELVRRNLNVVAKPQFFTRTDEGLRLFPTEAEWTIVENDDGNWWIV